MSPERSAAALSFLNETAERGLEQLDEFLRIPSVSADPSRATAMEEAASWLAGELVRIGVSNVEVRSTDLHPVVMGEARAGERLPTVLVYGHYDVQPEDPIEEWESPPFQPRREGTLLYARGASDDKGQLFMHVRVAEAFLATGGLPLNLRFLFDGEEEIGSPSLESVLKEDREKLAADLAVISDTPMFDRDLPSIGYGLRGLAYLQVRVRGPHQDLHSGQFGGSLANPANVLAGMLAALHDDRGRVTVPGFYDRVRQLSDEERRRIASLPFDEESYRLELDVPELAGEEGFSTLERLWVRPTLDVNGLKSGYQGEGAKTIIPARAEAKLSCRLVPDQEHREIARLVGDHIRELAPPLVRVEVDFIHGNDPWATSPDHPAFGMAARALEAAFGVKPVYQRDGGAIPVVPLLENSLGVPAMLVGFGLPDENKHAPNEFLDLRNYRRGMEALTRLWDELGANLQSGSKGVAGE